MIEPISIISVDGKISWTIKPHPDDISGFTGGQVGYRPLFWMPSSHPYLYLTGHTCCSDGLSLHHNQNGLVRFDLISGELVVLIPFSEDDYYFSFSPDGEFLLKESYGSNKIQVIRMKDGQVNAFHLMGKYDLINYGEWFQDGRSVVLIICEENDEFVCNEQRILVFNPETFSQKYLVKSARAEFGAPPSTFNYYLDMKKIDEYEFSIQCKVQPEYHHKCDVQMVSYKLGSGPQ